MNCIDQWACELCFTDAPIKPVGSASRSPSHPSCRQLYNSFSDKNSRKRPIQLSRKVYFTIFSNATSLTRGQNAKTANLYKSFLTDKRIMKVGRNLKGSSIELLDQCWAKSAGYSGGT